MTKGEQLTEFLIARLLEESRPGNAGRENYPWALGSLSVTLARVAESCPDATQELARHAAWHVDFEDWAALEERATHSGTMRGLNDQERARLDMYRTLSK